MTQPHPEAQDRSPVPFRRVRWALLGFTACVALLGVTGTFTFLDAVVGYPKPLSSVSAAGFLLMAAGLGLAAAEGARVLLRRLGLGLALGLGVVCLAFLWGHAGGESLGLEHGLAHARPGLLPTSFLTDLGVLGASLSYLLRWFPRHPRFAWRQAAAIAAALPWLLGLIILISYLAGAPVLFGSGRLPPSLASGLCLLGLGAVQILDSGLDTWPLTILALDAAREPEPRGFLRSLRWLFLVTGLAVAVGGLFFMRAQARALESQVIRELAATAELKTQQLDAWVAERMADAQQVATDPLIQSTLRRFLEGGNQASTAAELRTWMGSLRKAQFDQVLLLDARGQRRLSLGSETAGGESVELADLQRALRGHGAHLQDLHRHAASGHLHLSFWAPIAAKRPGEPPLGAVVMLSDPRHILFPLLATWPTPSPTAEMFLVRREGDRVAYLSGLRFRPDPPLAFHFPLTEGQPELGARAAAGEEGPRLGRDYRGVPVLGVLRKVAGTPWTLVAKMDQAEVFGPLRMRIWAGGLGILLVLGLLASGLGLVVRSNQAKVAREKLALTQRLAWLMQEANDIILVLDGDGRIQESNPQASAQVGHAPEALKGQPLADLLDPAGGASGGDPFCGLLPGSSARFTTRLRRKDGSLLPVDLSLRTTEQDDRPWTICFLRDISERVRQEEALRRMTRLYQTLSRVSQSAAWASSREELGALVCEALVEVGGFSLAWVGWQDPDTQRIVVDAQHGSSGQLMAVLQRGGDAAAEALGPVRIALRKDLPQVEPEIRARAASEAWGTRLLEEGFEGVAAFPIRQEGGQAAVLAVYAPEPGVLGLPECSLIEKAALELGSALDRLAGEARRRQAEQALQENEQLLREAQEAGSIGSYTWQLQENTWKSSPTLDAIFGIGSDYPRTLEGWVGLVEPSQREALNAYVNDLVVRRAVFDRDYPIRRPSDGALRWLHGRGVFHWGPDGQPTALVGVIQDITERKAMEETLRKVSMAVDQNPLAIVITDAQGTIEYVNPAFCASTGYTEAEAIGQNPRILRSPNTPPEHYRELWETLARGEVWSGEFENRRKDGTLFLERALIAPVRDGAGAATGYIALKQDITQLRKEAEERRALEAHLQQTQKLESLGSLAGGVAHDMNNVLGAVLGLSSALRASADPFGQEARSLDTIINACLRGRGVVKSLLYFARKDLQEEQLIDVNALVQEMVQLLSRTTLQKVQLALELQEGLGRLRGDPGALSHALMNLCVNAVDAMPAGGTLRVRTEGLPDGSLALTVADSGQGMEPEVLKRALEPFFTTKPLGQGTGLGLPMVFGTMKAHEGSFDLFSTPGQGTEAILHFPASRVMANAAAGGTPTQEAEAPLRPLHILLVDDDELIRDSVTPMLELLGHRVTCAAGGAKALLLLGSGLDADLVILDMNMPGMTGAETLPRILSLRPGLPVILATGYSDQEVAPLLRQHPTLSSLRKPFSLKEIRQELARRLAEQPTLSPQSSTLE